MSLGRVWRSSPGYLLAGYALLDVLLLAYTRTVGAAFNADIPVVQQLVGTLISVGLVWLVWWRRSRIAWSLSLLLEAWTLFALVVGGAVTAYVAPLLLVSAVQMAMLLSPAVRKHLVRPDVEAPPPAPDAV